MLAFIADTVPALREILFVLFNYLFIILLYTLLGFDDRKEMESNNTIVFH